MANNSGFDDTWSNTTNDSGFDDTWSNPVEKPKPKPTGAIQRFFQDTGVTALKGAIGVPETAVGLADLVTGGQAGKLAEDVGFRPKEAKQTLDEYYTPEQKLANQKLQSADGFVDTIKTAVENPSTIYHGAVESLPSMLGGGVISRGVMKVAPTVAPFVAGAIGEGAVTAGQNAEQVRQETANGLLTPEQALLQAGSGALTGVISGFGGKLADKLGIGDIQTMLANGGKVSGETVKSMPRRIIEGMASEGILQEAPQSAQEQIAQNLSLGKEWSEGVGNAAGMGALIGGVMGGGANIIADAPSPNARLEDTLPPDSPLAPPAPEGTLTRAAQLAGEQQLPEPDFTGHDLPPTKFVDGVIRSGTNAEQPIGGNNVSNVQNDDPTAMASNTIDPTGNNIDPSMGNIPDMPSQQSGLDATESPNQSFGSDIPVGTTDTTDNAIGSIVNVGGVNFRKTANGFERMVDETPADIAINHENDITAHDSATSTLNDLSQPTDAQKEAGNYKKGSVNVAGLNISIENPQGSKRTGTDPNGDAWETTMQDHYGYVKGVQARSPDKEHVDTYVKTGTPDNFNGNVFAVDQQHPDGSFDESKIMIGYANQAEAEKAYDAHYSADYTGKTGITEMPMDMFKAKLNEPKAFMQAQAQSNPITSETVNPTKTAPASQYSIPSNDEIKQVENENTIAGANYANSYITDNKNFTVKKSFTELIQSMQERIAEREIEVQQAKDHLDNAIKNNTVFSDANNPKDSYILKVSKLAHDKSYLKTILDHVNSPDSTEGEILQPDDPSLTNSEVKPESSSNNLTRVLVQKLSKFSKPLEKHDGFKKALKSANDLMNGKKVSPKVFQNLAGVLKKSNPKASEILMQLHQEASNTPEILAAKEKKSALAKALMAERSKLDISKDGLMQAMAKLGGLNSEEANKEFGIDPADMKSHGAGILKSFNKNGKSADTMRELLLEQGYPVGETVADFGNAIGDSMSGNEVLTPEGQEALAKKRYEEYSSINDELTTEEKDLLAELTAWATDKFGAELIAETRSGLASAMQGESQSQVDRALLRTLLEERDNEQSNEETANATEGQTGLDTQGSIEETNVGNAQQGSTENARGTSQTNEIEQSNSKLADNIRNSAKTVDELLKRIDVEFDMSNPNAGSSIGHNQAVLSIQGKKKTGNYLADMPPITKKEAEKYIAGAKNNVINLKKDFDRNERFNQSNLNTLTRINQEDSYAKTLEKWLELTNGTDKTSKPNAQNNQPTETTKPATAPADLLGDNTAGQQAIADAERAKAELEATKLEAKAKSDKDKADVKARNLAQAGNVDNFVFGEGNQEAKVAQKDIISEQAKEAEVKPKAPATDLLGKKLEEHNTKSSGEELLANKRGKTNVGLKWNDIADKNEALRVKEVVKQKVYPKPDYVALSENLKTGTEQGNKLAAYIIKTVYDDLATKPKVNSLPTDAHLKSYIEGINRVMEGVMKWVDDKDGFTSYLKRMVERHNTSVRALSGAGMSMSELIGKSNEGKRLLDFIYPDGYKAHIDEVRILGGNKALRAMQPSLSEMEKGVEEIIKGFPNPQEAWQRQGYEIAEGNKLDFSVKKDFRGRTSVFITYNNGKRNLTIDSKRFEGLEEGSKEVLDYLESKKDEFKDKFLLLDKNHDNLGAFNTEELAKDKAREATKRDPNSAPVISDKGISVLLATREGVARRMEGENISSDNLKETFGFKGVNFGNWLEKGDSPALRAERQLHLNHAYDSMMDLSEIMGVPPKAMSLNGMLGIAIGAQGTGGKRAAAAHFVAGLNEINLTRESGAGSLAHEWAHGLDHYFATLAGLARETKPYLTEHTKQSPTKLVNDAGMYKEVSRFAEGFRPEILDKFKAIVEAMNKRPITEDEYKAQLENNGNRAKLQVGRWIEAIGRDFKANNVDLEKFKAVSEKIKAGDLGDGLINIGGNKYVTPSVQELAQLYKESTGRNYHSHNLEGLQLNLDAVKYNRESTLQGKEHIPQVETDYAKNALELDKGKTKYWNTELEKFARAFDAYVSDTLADKAAKNTYLSHAGRAGATVPMGEERKLINKAFKGLVDTIDTKETDRGTALFSRSNQKTYPIAPRDEWYGDANYKADGGRLVYVTPDEYLAKVKTLKIDEVGRENIDDLKNHILSGKTLDPLVVYQNGKEDGRHRANAAKELGIKKVPVIDFGNHFPNAEQVPNEANLFSRSAQTQTPAFKKWFGDSKVVDAQGNPLVVYHGSPDARFMKDDATFKTIHQKYGDNSRSSAYWFAKDQSTANTYADERRAFDYQGAESAVIPAYLKLENPLIIDGMGKSWREAQARGKTSDVIEQAQQGGYDGVIIKNVKDRYNDNANSKTGSTDTYAVFNQNQIKSATENNGNFDTNNNNILMSRGEANTSQQNDSVQSMADEISKNWKNAPKIVVVTDMNDSKIPEAVRNENERQLSQGATGSPEGFYHAGKVYVVSSQVNTPSEVARVIMHETLGHFGLRGTFGTALNPVLKQISLLRNAEVKAKAKEYGLDMSKESDRNIAAEEVLAEMAQTNPQLSFVKNAIAAIRSWLRDTFPNMFGDMQLTDEEIIRDYLMPARDFVQTGTKLSDKTITRFSRRADSASWYYSQLGKAFQNAKIDNVPASQWKSWLMANAGQLGIKQEEIQWTGVNEWLDLQQGKVSKAQIADYLDSNGVQVQETTLGDTSHDRREARMKAANAFEAEGWTLDFDGFGDDGESAFYTDPEGEEVEYDDLPDNLKEAIDNASKDEIQGIDGNVKYESYKVAGGENYKELLLTLPSIDPYKVVPHPSGSGFAMIGQDGKYLLSGNDSVKPNTPIQWETEFMANKYGKPYHDKNKFRSSHWEQPNILAHIRFDERTDADGKKILFLHEIQSDWGQTGKKEGFNNVEKYNAAKRFYREAWKPYHNKDITGKEAESIVEKISKDTGYSKVELQDEASKWGDFTSSPLNIPTAPFVTKTDAWVALALKRMISYASQNGFDKVALINGKQAADLYDLSKQIDRVEYTLNDDNTANINAISLDQATSVIDKENQTQEQVADILGKEVAQSIFNDEGIEDESFGEDVKAIIGDGLKVGGEGMKYFYDNLVPKVAKDVLKKLGGSLDSANVKTNEGNPYNLKISSDGNQYWVTGENPKGNIGNEQTLSEKYSTYIEADKARIALKSGETSQTSFDITPAMREQVNQGLPLFSRDKKPSLTLDEFMSMANNGKMNLARSPEQELKDFKAGKSKFAIIYNVNADTVKGDNLLNKYQKEGYIVEPDKFEFGRHWIIARDISAVNEYNNAETPIDYGRLYGYSENDIARFYLNIRGGNPELGYSQYLADLKHSGKNITPQFSRSNQTDSPAFKNWFKKSKIVNEDGSPMVVYHGTKREFTEFQPKYADGLSFFTVNPQFASSWVRGTGGLREPPAGTEQEYKRMRDLANSLAEKMMTPTSQYDFNTPEGKALHTREYDALHDEIERQTGFRHPSEFESVAGTTVMPVYLSIQKPFDATKDYAVVEDFLRNQPNGMDKLVDQGYHKYGNWIVYENKNVINFLKEKGYDGIWLSENTNGVQETIAPFSSEQIKSAIGNNGNFDPNNKDIRYSRSKTVGESGRTRTPEQLAAFTNLGRTVEVPTLKERVASIWKDAGKKLAQGVADQFAPVKELSNHAYSLLRLSKGASGAFETMLNGGQLKLTDGVYDFDDTKRGGVVQRLLTPLQGEADDFLWYVAANRAEKLSAEDREHLFTPDDIIAMKSLEDGTTPFQYILQHGANAGQTTNSRKAIYADSLKTFNEFNKNTLDMAEQSGLIDGASRAIWENEFYVPFYRTDDDAGLRGMNVKQGVVRQYAFKQLKGGSNKLNSDLLENTLMNWSHLLDASAKNRGATATLEAAENMGIAEQVEEGTKGAVWAMKNGEKVHYVVDDPFVMTAISALEFSGMRSPIMNAMSTFKHALTVGVTASPIFKVRNLIRDSMQSIAVSGLSYNIPANIVNGYKLSNPKSDSYFKLLAGGGTIHFATMYEGSESRRVRSLVEAGVDEGTILDSESKLKAFYKRHIQPSIEAYNEVGNRGEAINRASLYDQMKKQGMSHAEATMAARDLLDFSMQGSFTSVRFLTQVVPFMNARIQGLYKLGKAANENPQKFGTVLGATAMFSIALMLANSDDDDWKKREDWDRDAYWWFKFGGIAYRIPKPFEIGAIASLAERGVELFTDDEMTGKRFAERLRALLSDNLSMNPIPQVVKPLIDLYANKDSFTGRPIESMSMERLLPEYRFNERSSMASRALSTAGNTVTGNHFLSPVQVDHLIQGYFSWLGTFIVSSADLLARPASDQPDRATPDYMKMATGGLIRELPEAQSRYVSQMYEQSKTLEQTYGTYRNFIKQHDMEGAREFRENNIDAIRQFHKVEHVKKLESKFNERIRFIERDRNLSSDEKRDRINVIKARQDKVARMLSIANTNNQ